MEFFLHMILAKIPTHFKGTILVVYVGILILYY